MLAFLMLPFLLQFVFLLARGFGKPLNQNLYTKPVSLSLIGGVFMRAVVGMCLSVLLAIGGVFAETDTPLGGAGGSGIIEKVNGRWCCNGEKLTGARMKELINTVPAAAAEYRKGKALSVVGGLAGLGAVLIGCGIGNAAGGGTAGKPLIIAGSIVLPIGIGFGVAAGAPIRKAIEIYNAGR